MQRNDANAEHWKAKFIDGLPLLFAEKVHQKLKDSHDGNSIPCSTYTYGHLIRVCTKVGLSICNEVKLQYQLKKQNLTSKKEIENSVTNSLMTCQLIILALVRRLANLKEESF